MTEIWREIPEFPDYRISNLGQVKSLKFGKERILKQVDNGHGYLGVGLSNGSKRKTFKTHRLLAMAFLGAQEWMDVSHINGDRRDNRLENLRPS